MWAWPAGSAIDQSVSAINGGRKKPPRSKVLASTAIACSSRVKPGPSSITPLSATASGPARHGEYSELLALRAHLVTEHPADAPSGVQPMTDQLVGGQSIGACVCVGRSAIEPGWRLIAFPPSQGWACSRPRSASPTTLSGSSSQYAAPSLGPFHDAASPRSVLTRLSLLLAAVPAAQLAPAQPLPRPRVGRADPGAPHALGAHSHRCVRRSRVDQEPREGEERAGEPG